jgi:hypothetical protein
MPSSFLLAFARAALLAPPTVPTLVFHGRRGQVAVAPPRLDAAVTVDGALDEPAWRQAALLTGFSQFAPKDGVPSADSTEVLVWYSPTAIHFGIRAFEPHGEVRATLSERDRIGNDDYVQLLLGTFNDWPTSASWAPSSRARAPTSAPTSCPSRRGA